MIQIISKYYKAILVLAGIALLISLIWIVDVRRKETNDALEYKLKHYMDSTNFIKEQKLKDVALQLDSVNINNQKTKKDEEHIKNLSHSALQLYVDSVYRANRHK